MNNRILARVRSRARLAPVGLGLVLLLASGLTGCMYYTLMKADVDDLEPSFVHVVFFWLKEGTTAQQKQQLIDDCKSYLGTVKTVRRIDVGTPAGTPRDVVDNSYGVAIVVYFKDREAHDYYQKAEKHLEFIKRNEDVWERVQVYDMIIDK